MISPQLLNRKNVIVPDEIIERLQPLTEKLIREGAIDQEIITVLMVEKGLEEKIAVRLIDIAHNQILKDDELANDKLGFGKCLGYLSIVAIVVCLLLGGNWDDFSMLQMLFGIAGTILSVIFLVRKFFTPKHFRK